MWYKVIIRNKDSGEETAIGTTDRRGGYKVFARKLRKLISEYIENPPTLSIILIDNYKPESAKELEY